MIRLEAERPEHGAAVEDVLDAALGPERRTKTCEILRAGRSPLRGPSLVALDGGRLVGAVRFWPVRVGRKRALMLGPLGVMPGWERRGIGGLLVRKGLKRARRQGERGVFLVGDASYYARFGFDAAATRGWTLPGPVEAARFLARSLAPHGLDGAAGAVAAA
jgi:predicted N-acetyltransferase YhbS